MTEKRRVVILGGGMAGLTTAYELAKTGAYDISVYQMGWRLGGKAASGRDLRPGRGARNLEHGLHVWFGYYENAFRLLQEVYAARRPADDCPFKAWTDAFKPQAHSGIGMEVDGEWLHVGVDWPEQSGFPGDGKAVSALWGAFSVMAGLMAEGLRATLGDAETLPSVRQAGGDDSELFRSAARAGFQPDSEARAAAERLADRPGLDLQGMADAAALWASSLLGRSMQDSFAHLQGLVRLLRNLEEAIGLTPADPAIRMLQEAAHIFIVTFRGAICDLVLPDKPFEALDHLDFRDWLLSHGADRDIVAHSSIVRLLYDISFQYLDGDLSRPSCAAGSCLGATVRMLGTYKGSMMYFIQGGFGDVVVAPLYEHLLAQGVKFHLFHKVTGLHPSLDGKRVGRVTFDVQARPLSGDYRPTAVLKGQTVWPSEPYWEQLVGGEGLKAGGVNFESHWCSEPPLGQLTLEAEQDFDIVVLALTMAAYKPLNPVDGSICETLFPHSPRFADFCTRIGVVPTMALQIWSDRSLEALGWPTGKSGTVSGPLPFDIWADMSQVIAQEDWPPDQQPRTLHYLCGTYSTDFHRRPSTESDVPQRAFAELRALSKSWLETRAYGLWPGACNGTGFDWGALSDASGAVGEARLDAQFWRANIDPTECCVGSEAGSTQFRLLPGESGFSNLILTGEGTRHGVNATAVEAAVMSGRAAAREICGQPETIPGFDFLTRKPSEGMDC